MWSAQCTFKPRASTSHAYICSPVNWMQVLIRQELQPPPLCLRCAKCYSWARPLASCRPGVDMTWLERRLVGEKKAIVFLFNVKSSGFVVLSVDIKAFPLPHYPAPPFNPTPYWSPTGVSPLTCSLILSFTPGLKSSYHRCASLRPHSCSFPGRAWADLSNSTILSRKTTYQTGIPKVYIWDVALLASLTGSLR